MNKFDYKPYAQKYQDIWDWSVRVKPFMTKRDRESFVSNVIRKNYNDLLLKAWDYIKAAKEQKKKDISEFKARVYQGREVKRLRDAKVGECFLFATSKGDIRYLKCVGTDKKTIYDHDEWCVADSTYSCDVPILVDNKGRKHGYSGYAAVISEDEFNKIHG